MKKYFLLIVVFTISVFNIKADTWSDPSWKEMISKSDLVGRFKVKVGGRAKAELVPIKIYHGKLKSETIWITGYSNKYGPLDTLKEGEEYLLFLMKTKSWSGRFGSWSNAAPRSVSEELSQAYFDVRQKKNGYSVWTPTSGDYLIKGDSIQYDLISTDNWNQSSLKSFPEFEKFLLACLANKHNKDYEKELIENLSLAIQQSQSVMAVQYLMMLHILEGRSDHPVFETALHNPDPEVRYALAKHMGDIKSDLSVNVLVKLLDDSNSVIQGEAVRQLSNQPSSFIGPIFISKIKTAGEGGSYAPLMSPVRNDLDGGKLEIVKALGKLKYKPAAPHLLPLLMTDNEYLFAELIATLEKLKCRDYVPYLIRILNEGNGKLMFEVSKVITRNNLTECIPAMMNYVKKLDKSVYPIKDYMISDYMGLSHFKSDTIKEFLFQDFLVVLKLQGGGAIDSKCHWVEAYMEVFKESGEIRAKPFLYDFMLDYYGINEEFKKDESFFAIRQTLEDSMKFVVSQKLEPDLYDNIDVMVKLVRKTNKLEMDDYVVTIWVKDNPQSEDIVLKLENSGIPRNHLIVTTGRSSYLYSPWNVKDFGDNLMREFLEYLVSCPDKGDLRFIQNLAKYQFPKTDYQKQKLADYEKQAAKKLK